MPPHHLILILLGLVGIPTILTFFSLLHSHPRGKLATESSTAGSTSSVRALFSFHTPSTLFPPSAIISLTDDNSTFFLARPADFGPSLSAKGLSGELWIGSGFGDDNLGRGAGSGAEGELGCSDVPGWDDILPQHRRDFTADQSEKRTLDVNAAERASANAGQQDTTDATVVDGRPDKGHQPSEHDGTDDHLHQPLATSPVSKPSEPGQPAQHESSQNGQQSTHADIQSLQESAEISGKIVLLSRGGCGFLEKVKWAQRRGGTALIVGDHTRGGALVTMYARGDTSNITIPSLFTSHTTAHLLSSLIPPENFIDEIPLADGTIPGPGLGKVASGMKQGLKNKVDDDDRPTFTSTASSKSTSAPIKRLKGRRMRSTNLRTGASQVEKTGWFRSLTSGLGFGKKPNFSGMLEDSRRPPSSGRLDWFSEKWTEESLKESRASSQRHEKAKALPTNKEARKSGIHPNSGDDFLIGVHDWRDPDLVEAKVSPSKGKSTTSASATGATPLSSKGAGKGSDAAEHSTGNVLAGGSITPGSGQYYKPGQKFDYQENSQIGGDDGKTSSADLSNEAAVAGFEQTNINHLNIDSEEEHDGLWVTLTPTTMSNNPFFDTLLVLVVSPLVTLTVVYALLLLRSRIRRRRWRAPKSVVDRLPIRTYHTMSCASTTSSTRLHSTQASSPTSPLLHNNSRATATRSRPRSATAGSIGDAIARSLERATTKASIRQGEKDTARAVPRKRYNGKQIECVVCLEEYVDGQSRVMSLPCGHEFHAECM